MNRRKVVQWIPFVVTLILSVIVLIAYTLMADKIKPLIYIQILALTFVPAVFPLLAMITRKQFPLIINILITIHIFLAGHLGSAMGFYGRFASWDLIMHGHFGFVAGVTLYVFMLKWNGEKMNRIGFLILIFLSTLGGAAVWEIFEYTCDTLLNNDAQRVQASLALGISPVKDTMTDIIVALVGLAVFYMGLFVDKLCGYKLSRKIYMQVVSDHSRMEKSQL